MNTFLSPCKLLMVDGHLLAGECPISSDYQDETCGFRRSAKTEASDFLRLEVRTQPVSIP